MKAIIRIFLVFFLSLVIGMVGVFITQPQIPLGRLASVAATIWNRLSDNELVIRGNYYLTPGEWVILRVQDGSFEMHEENGFKITSEIPSAETKIHLMSVFKKQVLLDGISANGLKLDIKNVKEKGTKEQTEERRDKLIPGFLRQTGKIDFTDLTTTIKHSPDEATRTYYIEKVEGSINNQSSGKLEVKGSFDERTFNVELEIGSLESFKSNMPLPFTAQLAHKSITAMVNGQIDYVKTGPTLDAGFSLSGDHPNDLFSLIGAQSPKDKPFSLKGHANLSKEEMVITIDQIYPGTTDLTTSISIADIGTQNEVLSVSVEGKQLDFDSLKDFFSIDRPDTQNAYQKARKDVNNLDLVVIPKISITRNFFLKCDVKQVVIASRKIDNFTFNAVVNNGVITNAPFAATFENSILSGHYSLDLSGDTPQLSANLTTNSWDVGATLEEYNLAEGVDLYLENFISNYSTSGRTLRELLKNMELRIEANNGSYLFRDPNTEAILPIKIREAIITSAPGSGLSMALDGEINTNPISISLKIDDRKNEMSESVDEVAFFLEARRENSTWTLGGTIPVPYRLVGLTLHSSMTGEKLSDLDQLLKVNLPPMGSYRLDGILQVVPDGYKFTKIEAEIGSNVLHGDLFINTKARPLELSIELNAEKIQLDDFRKVAPEPEDKVSQTDKKHAPQKDPEQKYLTDQAVIDKYNAMISVEVKEVFSGADYLGSGLLKVEQLNGKFKVAPLKISMPAGNMSLDFSMEPYGEDHLYSFDTHIEKLDYGVVGRWFKPDTDMAGVVNVRSSLTGISPDYKSFMANASGYIDFSLQPKTLRAGVIDLWAVNLFSFLVPVFNPDNKSKINCAAGRFNVNDGILKQDGILIDTSRIQVKGTVEVDFEKKWVKSRLRPIPKRPQFYSLSTPVQISGNIEKLKVGVAKGGIIGTTVRLVTSFIVVPIQWIILDKVPTDGTEECLEFARERIVDQSTPQN